VGTLPVLGAVRQRAVCLDCLARRGKAPLGERIKAARIAAGLTVPRLARLVGLTVATVSRYESGRRCPSRKALERLADVPGVAP
jgi:DNA-binding transcriptional regulator YiaG